ncbi:MAG: SemiSWEET transporter [Ignavibacteria bacterium]|jgi:MtN3 and saliva related transmembrane protein
MDDNLIIINIIGTLAGILTTSSYLPQVIKVVRTRSAGDISLWMFIMMNTGILMWLVYGILVNAFPIIVTNSVTLILSLTILWYKIKLTQVDRQNPKFENNKL